MNLEADADVNVRVTTIQFMKKWILTAIGISLSLVLGYLFLKGSRYSQLIGFFGYMSVACTLIPLPTPPYVIALGKIFHPSIVAITGAIGNTIAAFVEYHLLFWLLSRTELQQRVETNRIFQRFSHYFRRMAFVCLVFTGFTPIPFEPFRFAAILTRYNLPRYLLAVLIGRFPRYYLIALIGDQFQIPTRYLIILLIVSLAIPIIGVLIKHRPSVDNGKT